MKVSSRDPRLEAKSLSRYRLEHGGHLLEVEARDVGLGHAARLFIDRQLRDEQKAGSGRAELRADDCTVRVTWCDFGGVKTCEAIVCDEGGQPLRVAFTPPPGSRAARLAQLRRDHPALYAARHLAKPVLQALVPILGLGAILTALLPRIDWSWLPPFVRDKLFGDGPTWLEPLLGSPIVQVGKWALPIVLALFVALDEYEKRRKDTHGSHR